MLAPKFRLPGVAAWPALFVIVGAFFLYGSDVPTPGLFTIVPVLAAATLMVSLPRSRVLRHVVERRWPVHLGQISYSLYLWHQPMIFFVRMVAKDPSPVADGIALALSYGAALASYHFIEQPFRRASNPKTARQQRHAGFVAAAAIAVLSVTLWLGNGSAWRFGPNVEKLVSTAKDAVRKDSCSVTGPVIEVPSACRSPDSDGAISVMLIGDSHARSVSHALGDLMAARDIGFQYLSRPGCYPLSRASRPTGPTCDTSVDGMLMQARQAGVDVVVMVGRSGLARPFPGTPELERPQDVLAGYRDRLQDIARDFTLIIAEPLPDFPTDIPAAAARQYLEGKDGPDLTLPLPAFLARNEPLIDILRGLAGRGVSVVPVWKALCDEASGLCRLTDDFVSMFTDSNHLSRAGARLVAPLLAAEIERVLQRGDR